MMIYLSMFLIKKIYMQTSRVFTKTKRMGRGTYLSKGREGGGKRGEREEKGGGGGYGDGTEAGLQCQRQTRVERREKPLKRPAVRILKKTHLNANARAPWGCCCVALSATTQAVSVVVMGPQTAQN